MSSKIAKLKFEMTNGMFALAKISDMETGMIIPFSRIQLDLGFHNQLEHAQAIITVPIDTIELETTMELVPDDDN